MKNRIDISHKYTKETLPFKSGAKYVHSPKIPAVIKDPASGIITSFAYDFLIDTGASISIINAKYESFIKNVQHVDELKIRYGGGKEKWVKIYDLILIIKGNEIAVKVAYDEALPYLLLGQYNFFEDMTYQLFDPRMKKTRLVKN